MKNKYKLEGKVAAVTGGSQGIGKGIVKNLLISGAKVAVLSRSEQSLKNTCSELSDLGDIIYYAIDVKDFLQVQGCMKKVAEKWGKIDILINNAGITNDKLAIRMTDNNWDEVINTNLKGTFNCIKSVLPNMLKNKNGKIINISSIVGIMGNAGQSNYSASKAGIIGLTKSIAKEYGAKSINVNAIAPGLIETNMTEEIDKNILSKNIILNRNGLIDDVANLACFLCTEDASYITGQVINIDGGLLI